MARKQKRRVTNDDDWKSQVFPGSERTTKKRNHQKFNNKSSFSSCHNEYSGYKLLTSNKTIQIDIIDPTIMTPETFFKEYIVKRKPCLISKIQLKSLTENEKRKEENDPILQLSNLEYLKQKGCDVRVQIEQKINGRFGSGEKRKVVSFGQFLDDLKNGNEDWYMTTQYESGHDINTDSSLKDSKDSKKVQEEEEEIIQDCPSIENMAKEYCQNPLRKFTADFPFRPYLLQTLAPQQVNLWMGSCSQTNQGTSSGLHHDFADNLYVLLKGKKKFTLFDPSQISNLYTVGRPSRVYPNGYIVYKDEQIQNNKRQDHNPANKTRSDGAVAMDIARWRVEKAERNLALLQDENDNKDKESILEEAIEEMEQDLDLAMNDLLELQMEDEEIEFESNHGIDERGPKNQDPPSFSKIPPESLHNSTFTSLSNSSASFDYPLLQSAKKVVVEMEQGQMLYLPTGWFHEVNSSGLSSKDPIHIAFNYWFHAPCTDVFDVPYEDEFWEDRWEKIQSYFKR